MTLLALAQRLHRLTPAEVWDAIYQARFTGRLVIHFAGGIPRLVEVPPAPHDTIRIPLATAEPSGGIDKAEGSGHS